MWVPQTIAKLVHVAPISIGFMGFVNQKNVWGHHLVYLMLDSRKTYIFVPDLTPRIAFTMSGTVDGQTQRFEKPWFITFVMLLGYQNLGNTMKIL